MQLTEKERLILLDYCDTHGLKIPCKTCLDNRISDARYLENIREASKDKAYIKSLEKVIAEIKVAYESEDENELDEVLHGLFTNQLDEDY